MPSTEQIPADQTKTWSAGAELPLSHGRRVERESTRVPRPTRRIQSEAAPLHALPGLRPVQRVPKEGRPIRGDQQLRSAPDHEPKSSSSA